MKVLVLYDVVEVVDMYEFIILCVIIKKYMYILCGIFELKYFFFSYVFIVDGGECFVMVICVLIKKLIVVELLNKFLSDNKIVIILFEQGINVV